jgi:hypothetical protein
MAEIDNKICNQISVQDETESDDDDDDDDETTCPVATDNINKLATIDGGSNCKNCKKVDSCKKKSCK